MLVYQVCLPKHYWEFFEVIVVFCFFFYSEGSRETPSHRFSDFKFKSYSPVAFRYVYALCTHLIQKVSGYCFEMLLMYSV